MGPKEVERGEGSGAVSHDEPVSPTAKVGSLDEKNGKKRFSLMMPILAIFALFFLGGLGVGYALLRWNARDNNLSMAQPASSASSKEPDSDSLIPNTLVIPFTQIVSYLAGAKRVWLVVVPVLALLALAVVGVVVFKHFQATRKNIDDPNGKLDCDDPHVPARRGLSIPAMIAIVVVPIVAIVLLVVGVIEFRKPEGVFQKIKEHTCYPIPDETDVIASLKYKIRALRSRNLGPFFENKLFIDDDHGAADCSEFRVFLFSDATGYFDDQYPGGDIDEDVEDDLIPTHYFYITGNRNDLWFINACYFQIDDEKNLFRAVLAYDRTLKRYVQTADPPQSVDLVLLELASMSDYDEGHRNAIMPVLTELNTNLREYFITGHPEHGVGDDE